MGGPRPTLRIAAGIALVGSLGFILAGLLWPHAIPVVLGLAGVVVAAGLWRGSDTARVVAVVAGPLAILPALFGAWGLKVTAEGWWEMCSGRLPAPMAAAVDIARTVGAWAQRSYPPDYCERVDWVSQWGIGLGLTGAGVAGILVAGLLIVGRSERPVRGVTPGEQPPPAR